MLLHQQTEETGRNAASELRLDQETAEKVTALALRLQEKRAGTLSVREIEAAGAEVGLRPEFVREALAQVRQSQGQIAIQTTDTAERWARWGKVIHPAWWASGWAFPVMLAAASEGLHIPDEMTGAAFIGAMGLYVGVGVVLSKMFGDESSKPLTPQEQEALIRSIGNWARPASAPLVAAQRLSPLTASTRAASIAGESYLKLVPRCAFGAQANREFSPWALAIIWEEGGELLSANAEGIECRFPSANAALRAARRLQTEVRGSEARLGIDALACGVASTSGETHRLAASAGGGDIMVDESLAAEGLRELGRLARFELDGSGALSWKAGRDG
jgi:hypothetical protein